MIPFNFRVVSFTLMWECHFVCCLRQARKMERLGESLKRKKIRFFRRFILRREVIFGWRIDTMVTELVEVGRGSDMCMGGQILDS